MLNLLTYLIFLGFLSALLLVIPNRGRNFLSSACNGERYELLWHLMLLLSCMQIQIKLEESM